MIQFQKGQKMTVHDAEEMEFALKLLENAGFVWINGGEKPTAWLPHEKIANHTFPDSINWHSDGKICRGSYPTGVEWTIKLGGF